MPRTVICLRVIGALALLVVAADHLYEYWVDDYSVIPTIGTLFLLNGIGAIGLAVLLLVPWGAFLSRRSARRIVALTAAAGVILAATTLAGLFVSESEPLFGFMEVGYRPVIYVAIAAEALAIVALTPLAFALWRADNGGTRAPAYSTAGLNGRSR